MPAPKPARDTSVFRPARKNPYTAIPVSGIFDPNLSHRARGIWIYIIAHGEKWEARMSDIIAAGLEGPYAVREAMTELILAGYVTRTQGQHPLDGTFYWIFAFHDSPVPPAARTPLKGKIRTKRIANLIGENAPQRGKRVMDPERGKRAMAPQRGKRAASISTYIEDIDLEMDLKSAGARANAPETPTTATPVQDELIPTAPAWQPGQIPPDQTSITTEVRPQIKAAARKQGLDPLLFDANGHIPKEKAFGTTNPIIIYYVWFSIADRNACLTPKAIGEIRNTVQPHLLTRWFEVCRTAALTLNYRTGNLPMLFDWLFADATAKRGQPRNANQYAKAKQETAETTYDGKQREVLTGEALATTINGIRAFERDGIPVADYWYEITGLPIPGRLSTM